MALFFVLLSSVVFSQSCPPNLDFENGDFSNWECFTGYTKAVGGQNQMVLTLSGPVANRHQIISSSTSGSALDAYGLFPRLCPYGGNYSVQLGNNSSGGEAEGLSYTFQVPTSVDTFTFTYFYAVVFENPSHTLPEQPRFFVTAYDVATGNVINCASYDYVSTSSLPGFKKSTINSNVLYKEWTPTSLQFAGLSGRMVRLEFKTADCTLGGHFGYAYVDVASACSNILATAPYCVETNSLILNAPYGFQSYTWYNDNFTQVVGNQQSITLSPPPATSGVFHVDMVPYPGYGCRDTLQAMVKPLPVPDTPVAKSSYVYCQLSAASPLTATALPSHLLLWYTSATGGTGSTLAPTPPTNVSGEFAYYVSQKTLFGCESFRKKITVKIAATPLTSFKANSLRQCQNGNSFVFTSFAKNLSNPVYYWDFGDGTKQSSPIDTVASHTYASAGSFTVRLKVVNDSTCASEIPLVVTVVPKPVASFSYPAVVCEAQTPLAFVNNSTVPNGVSAINGWWWNIGGVITNVQSPNSLAPLPGALLVQQVVVTTEGCRSDTNKVTVNIRYRPPASFTAGTLFCNNEVISFTDRSIMPAAAVGENIVKWYWRFDNTATNAPQNPSLNLSAGVHTVSLVTETIYGCKSKPYDTTFTVYPKPNVLLEKNDSCVNRAIVFSATDVLGNVDKWYWDFGNRPTRSAAVVSKVFPKEGTYPCTLLTYTAQGCKDTIIRPFVIYDNKAFAGRDTVAAKGQPVQLNAAGGANVSYTWSPARGLNNANVENPVAVLDDDQQYELFAVTDKGCDSRSRIFIKRYAGPTVYIPTAFTPNADGRNDALRVVPVGMKTFNYFAVFNRYGQLLYKSTDPNKGWDGRYNGVPQPTGTFVVLCEALDYRGRPVVQKELVTLIR